MPTNYEYILESLSDLGNCIFLLINGAYKAAKLMLRSSIETFFKGVTSDSLPNVLTEKRVFKIFDDIKELPLFIAGEKKSCFDELLLVYSELCRDTHTATIKNMQKISALNYFPSKDMSLVNDIENNFSKLVSNYLFILSMKYNDSFHKMYYVNKAVVFRAMIKKHRPIVQNVC